MFPYQFLNLTTKRPFKKENENRLKNLMHLDAFKKLKENQKRRADKNKPIQIFFVNEEDICPYAKENGIDRLGVYVPFQVSANNTQSLLSWPEPLNCDFILICPERIFNVSLKSSQEEACYDLLLINVLLHELAHALMAVEPHCKDNILNAAFDSNGLDLYNSKEGVLIEESLATAFSLIHHFSDEEKKLLRKFIKEQPINYREGLHWEANAQTVLNAMLSWKRLQEMYHNEIKALINLNKNPLLDFANQLKNEKVIRQNFLEIDFVKKFTNWQGQLKSYMEKNNNSLKGIAESGLSTFDGLFSYRGISISFSDAFFILAIDDVEHICCEDQEIENLFNKVIEKNKIDKNNMDLIKVRIFRAVHDARASGLPLSQREIIYVLSEVFTETSSPKKN